MLVEFDTRYCSVKNGLGTDSVLHGHCWKRLLSSDLNFTLVEDTNYELRTNVRIALPPYHVYHYGLGGHSFVHSQRLYS